MLAPPPRHMLCDLPRRLPEGIVTEGKVRERRDVHISPREGCSGPALIAIIAVLAVCVLASTHHVIAQTTPPPKSLLTASDFTFLGAFRLPRTVGIWDTAYGRGLTH